MKNVLLSRIVLILVSALITSCSKENLQQTKSDSTFEKVETESNKINKLNENTAQKIEQSKEDVIELGKGVKLEMVLIPRGDFKMGSPESEEGREKNETQHHVIISESYYMGKYEVTQEQWKAIMGKNPSRIKGPKLPVTDVSWDDCKEFIKKLNEKTKEKYRLPTEAEWEYACRARTTTAYSYGDDITDSDANISSIGEPTAVGSYKPNNFGLYDMHGNVWEWCEDKEGEYPASARTDPKGPLVGDYRILRGGSFGFNVFEARSANRGLPFAHPSFRESDYGFRLAKTK